MSIEETIILWKVIKHLMLYVMDFRPAPSDGGVVVKVTGTQVPVSITVSEALAGEGAEKVSSELTAALKSAHVKSGTYAQNKMAEMYEELGLSKGMAGPPGS